MSEYMIAVPRIGTNDDYVVIGSWYVKNGDRVTKGQKIASLETTKETVDFTSEFDGYIFYRHEEYDEVEVGKELAIISHNQEFKFCEEMPSEFHKMNMTKKARQLVEECKINVSALDNSKIIREADIRSIMRSEFIVTRNKANDVIIVTGGGLAKMCIDLLKLNKAYNIHGIVDDGIKIGTKILGIPVIGTVDDLSSFRKKGYFTAVNAIGSIGVDNTSKHFFQRKKFFEKVKNAGYFVPTLIHPSAQIAPTAQIGEGVIVMENAVIGSNVKVGNDVIINTGSVISHDCVICDHARISPGAILAGEVKVGENALIGMGATVYLGIKIGKNAVISNGQNIFCDVSDRAVIK